MICKFSQKLCIRYPSLIRCVLDPVWFIQIIIQTTFLFPYQLLASLIVLYPYNRYLDSYKLILCLYMPIVHIPSQQDKNRNIDGSKAILSLEESLYPIFNLHWISELENSSHRLVIFINIDLILKERVMRVDWVRQFKDTKNRKYIYHKFFKSLKALSIYYQI